MMNTYDELEYLAKKREYWEEVFNIDDDPYPTWEEFADNWLWCNRCKSYQEGQCICYAR